MGEVSALPEIEGAQSVRLEFDDVELGGYAWWDDGVAPAFLVLHGWGEDASTMAPVAAQIRARSWHAVTVSMRGWRGSTGVDDYGLSASKDLGRVLAWIRREPRVSSVVLLGFSMGGLMASLTAADQRRDELAGLLVVSAPSHLPSFYRDTAFGGVRRYFDATLQPRQWRDSSPLTHAERLVHPMLVVTGTDDSMAPPDQGRRLAEAVPQAEHLEIEGMGHHPSAQQWERILSAASGAFGL
ncbi:MAG: alpha/beta fold hydrolase [Nesterenkonia sp.]|uniref:alpha/beta hydrolase family protein n=1 Tax=Nesterenkonia marinintestina TaxID=2979865 RepID=UPI0021BFE093|nr:alpha/beta fold hydrolase [Nesterenkonia sp. GX14115]MDO5493099.1 alpha/beta fold hydrolase [Nesterenkonia sp.]